MRTSALFCFLLASSGTALNQPVVVPPHAQLPVGGLRLIMEGGSVQSLSFSPDSKTLATASSGASTARLFHLPDGRLHDTE